MRVNIGSETLSIYIYDDEEFRLAPRLEAEFEKPNGTFGVLELLIVDSLSREDEMFPNGRVLVDYVEGEGNDYSIRNASSISVEITYDCLENLMNQSKKERYYETRIYRGDRLLIKYLDFGE